MPWSTAQIADLAGVTVKTVRHYHVVGVLDEPERAVNGYKEYRIEHLVRVLQVKRLSDLGVPLAQVVEVLRAEEQPSAALRVIDAELEATVSRLRRVRGELMMLLRHGIPTNVPPGFDTTAASLSDADRALLLVSSRVLDDEAMDDLRAHLRERPRTEAEDVFDALPADASEAEIARAATLLRARVHDLREAHPWVSTPVIHAARDAATTGSALAEAVGALYNAAQREVLRRLPAMRSPDEA